MMTLIQSIEHGKMISQKVLGVEPKYATFGPEKMKAVEELTKELPMVEDNNFKSAGNWSVFFCGLYVWPMKNPGMIIGSEPPPGAIL